MTDSITEPEEGRVSLVQRFRKGISNLLGLGGVACLIAFVAVIGYMWLFAWQHGLYPAAPIRADSPYGAWLYDRTGTLEHLSNVAFRLVEYAFLAGMLSSFVKVNERAIVVVFFSVFCFFIGFGHIMLLED